MKMSLACRNGSHRCEPRCTDDGGAKCTVWKYTNTDLQHRSPAMMYECGGKVCFGSTSMLCDCHGSWKQSGTGQPLTIHFHFAGDEDKLKTTFLFPQLHGDDGRPIYFTGYDYKGRFILLEKRLAIDIAGRVAHGDMSRNRNNNQQQAGHMSYPPWSRNRNNNQHRRTRSRKMLEDSGFLSRNGSHRAALPLRGLSIWRSCRTDLHMDASAVDP